MPTLPVLRAVAWTSGASAQKWDYDGASWTAVGSALTGEIGPRLDEPVTSSAASGDTGYGLALAANGSVTNSLSLTDTPADFVSMDTLSIRYSTAQVGTYSDDSTYVAIRVVSSGTIIAGYSTSPTLFEALDRFNGVNWTLATSLDVAYGAGSGSAPSYNKTVAFTYVDTSATKAQWDAAIVELRFYDSRNMGSDSATIVLVDFELEGTYTGGVAPVTHGIQINQAVQRSAVI